MLTVAITNHNYRTFLLTCICSALRHADEVIVYDDGSTDDSLQLLEDMNRLRAAQGRLRIVSRPDASGSPVWGSNRAIEDASGDWLMWLDADNFMMGRPEYLVADYTYAPIVLVDFHGSQTGMWEYDGWPLTADEALMRFLTTKRMPIAWGGVWRVEWLRENGCQWSHWPSTKMAADFKTCIDWLRKGPSLAYQRYPVLAFRQHDGQFSASDERSLMERDALHYALTLGA